MAQSLGGREPLQRLLSTVRLTEGELASQLHYASLEIERILRGRVGAVRRAQYQAALQEIREYLDDLWTDALADTVTVGKRRAVDAAADAAYDVLGYYGSSQGIRLNKNSLRATAREGIQTLISRSSNDIALSARVYRNRVAAGSAIQRVVNDGVTAGKSAREIAKAAASLIDPATPGGVSYAAMRLGRSELNNAFHTTTIKEYAANPFVESMAWRLSGSHPEVDICDELAAKGPYEKNHVPPKPHPQCFCTVLPVVVDEDEFVRQFKAGRYNDYLDKRIAGDDYERTEIQRAAAIQQRRVVTPQGKIKALADMSPQQRTRYLNADERALWKQYNS